MQNLFESSKTTYQEAFGLTAQVLNSISVPMGSNQYGTDSSESGSSGEGSNDHTVWGLIRDHGVDPAIYYRDSFNPSFRRLRLADLDLSSNAIQMSLLMEEGAYFIDMKASMTPL